jgi:hypothetical protein
MARWLLAVLLTLPIGQAKAALTEVEIHVAVAEGIALESVELETTWLGKDHRLQLTAEEGAWTGTIEGDAVRFLPVALWVRQAEAPDPYLVWRGIEPLATGAQRLSFSLDRPGESPGPRAAVTAHRVSQPGNLRHLRQSEKVQLALGFAWLAGVFLLARWIARRPKAPPALDVLYSHWWSPLIWTLLAIAWTWPAIRSGEQSFVGRHFDALGTIWTLGAANDLLRSLQDLSTAWPAGADYQALDSYLLLPIGWLLDFMHPARVHGLLQVMGLVFSAWAAEGFARAVGARRPWTLIAGLSFAFSGLAANALLEGHVYHVANPWLPLFAWATWRATSENGRIQHALLATAALTACLATTGYLGATALLIGAGFVVGGFIRAGRKILAPVAVGLGTSLPIVWAYGRTIGSAGADRALLAQPDGVGMASAHLANLAAVTSEIDRVDHSLAPLLGGIILATMILAPGVLGHRERWKTLAGVSLGALVLSFGPALSAAPGSAWFPMPLGLLEGLPGLDRLRFPARLLWAWSLCGGVLAARVATALADRKGSITHWLLLAAAVEAFAVVRLPFRQVERPAGIPSAYAYAQGPVLDFFPEPVDDTGEMNRWFSATSCYYQLAHDKPIVDHCATVPEGTNRRVQANRWLSAALTTGAFQEVRDGLSTLGFTDIAFHPDLFPPVQRERLQTALASTGTWATASLDGGEHIELFRLPSPKPVQGADLAALGASIQVLLATQAVGSASSPPHVEFRDPGQAVLGKAELLPGDALPGRLEAGKSWVQGAALFDGWPAGSMAIALGSGTGATDGTELAPQEPHVAPSYLHGPGLVRAGPFSTRTTPVGNPSLGSMAAAGWGAYLLLALGWGLRREED